SSTLYVGGDFTGLGGFVRNRLGTVDAATAALGTWNPNADGSVTQMSLSSGTMYVGGQFTTVGGTARSRLASVSATTGAPTTWNPNPDGAVNVVAPNGSTASAAGLSN